MKKKEKGQIEVYQIVITVLAILGLAIALLLWSLFKNTADVSDETCHLSVLTRGTAPDSLQAFVPLKCTTKKICITQKSEKECKQFLGEENVRVEVLKGKDDEKARQIENIVVDSMYNCWSMMGEGKLNLFNGKPSPNVAGKVRDGVKDVFYEEKIVGPSCFICSRLSIGEDLKNADGMKILEKVDSKRALERNIPGQSKTYLEYFTDDQFKAYTAEIKSELGKPENSRVGESIKPTDQVVILFTQIVTEGNPLEKAGNSILATTIVVGGASFSGITGKILSVVSVKARVAITALSGLGAGGLAYYNTYKNQELSAMYCGQFTDGERKKDGSPEKKYGCSVISQVDYRNIAEINKNCQITEGNP